MKNYKAREFLDWCEREIARLDAENDQVNAHRPFAAGSTDDVREVQTQAIALGIRQARDAFCNTFNKWSLRNESTESRSILLKKIERMLANKEDR